MKFEEIIKNSKKIAIFSHINPDADALCSSFALRNIIKNNYHDKYVDVFVGGEIGELYNPILREETVNPEPYSSYDLAFVLDCPTLERIGDYQELAEQIPFVINIDHHETNAKFGNINVVVSKASSTCEIIYLIAKAQKYALNDSIAKELYQGIITDTNCFTSFSLTQKSHMVLSELMGYKFNADMIKEYYFKNNSISKTKLLSGALRTLKFYENGKLTTMKIPHKLFEISEATFEDSMGIVDNGININNAEVCAILIEKDPNEIYCSLRSKGEVDVGAIAKELGGGGSTTIAAFQTNGDILEIEKQVVKTISPHLILIEKKDILF